MQHLYDKNAPKKPTNLSINSNLLSKARDLDINLSATLEKALESELRQNTQYFEKNYRTMFARKRQRPNAA